MAKLSGFQLPIRYGGKNNLLSYTDLSTYSIGQGIILIIAGVFSFAAFPANLATAFIAGIGVAALFALIMYLWVRYVEFRNDPLVGNRKAIKAAFIVLIVVALPTGIVAGLLGGFIMLKTILSQLNNIQ